MRCEYLGEEKLFWNFPPLTLHPLQRPVFRVTQKIMVKPITDVYALRGVQFYH